MSQQKCPRIIINPSEGQEKFRTEAAETSELT